MESIPKWGHDLVAGRLCLELANTVGGLRGHEAPDYLRSYDDLLAWAASAGALSPERAAPLAAEARRRPEDAARVVEEARALREALHDAVQAHVAGKPAAAEHLAVVNRSLARALPRRRLACGEGDACCRVAWDDDPAALDAPLWPVAVSAMELLTSPRDLARVRVCGGAEEGTCGWLFVDDTKSGTRRWCSMRDCGNRAKQRRHYRRARGEPAGR